MKTDAQLRHDIQQELGWDPAVKSTEIGVIVKDGVVTLTGDLTSYAEKHAVEHAVQRVHGVKAVAVEMHVRLAPALERSDADIALAARRALDWSVLVPDGRVQIAVEKGWLTLTGEVVWGYEREAAERCVHDLIGVVHVDNQIIVKPRVHADGVAKGIHDALARQAERDARHIEVVVSGSFVTLRGKVRSLAERSAAQGAALSAPGVTAVVNELTVEA